MCIYIYIYEYSVCIYIYIYTYIHTYTVSVDVFAFGKMLRYMAEAQMYGASLSENELVAKTLLQKWTPVIARCLDDTPLNRPTAVAIHTEVWGGTAPDGYKPLISEPGSVPSATRTAQESALKQDTLVPSTLRSRSLEQIGVLQCTEGALSDCLLSSDTTSNKQLPRTLSAAIDLCFKHASGPALVLIGEKEEFMSVFCDEADAPTLRSVDHGYMKRRLRKVHVSDPRFPEAFRDFTGASDGGCWPKDYTDSAAWKLQKDGAFVLDVSGYCIKAAALPCGIVPPATLQHKAGRLHSAALACAWAVRGCIALVRDSDGSVDGMLWHHDSDSPIVYRVAPPSSHATWETGRSGGLSL